MSREIMGTVVLFPYGPDRIKPSGYLLCDGSQYHVNRYGNLFRLIGTSFGGDGVTFFNVPNLNYMIPVGAGEGQRGVSISFGKTGGNDTVTLHQVNIAPHTHPGGGHAFIGGLPKDDADSNSPKDGFLRTTPGVNTYAASADSVMGGREKYDISSTSMGEGKKMNNMQPTIAMAYYICWDGDFPRFN